MLHRYHEEFSERTLKSPAIGLHINVQGGETEVPVHHHSRGQLMIATGGFVTCEVPNAIYAVLPYRALWIPGGIPHSVRATSHSRISYIFLNESSTHLPDYCCTLKISTLARELIFRLAQEQADHDKGGHLMRKAQVLLDELHIAERGGVNVPTSSHLIIERLVHQLLRYPAQQKTLPVWASELALSERSLARLVIQQTGMTFGHLRRQTRLVVALQQLAEGMSVQQTADHIGYQSVTAFITMFKHELGYPPAHYVASYY